MSGITDEASDKKRRLKKTLVAMTLGAMAGFVATFLFLEGLESGALPEIGASREIASLVGILFVLIALIIGFGIISPKHGSKVLNVEDAEELEEQKADLFYSALVMLIAGLSLMILAFAEPVGPIGRGVALAAFLASTLATVVCSLAAQKDQDELMREISKECAAVAFYLVTAIGGTWSVLAHLGYAAAPAPLDWMTMFWGFTLLAAFITTGRRGLLAMR